MTLREIYQAAKAENKTEICRFMRDMRRAGLKMRAYNGRYFWSGPAVVMDDLQGVLGATKVRCQTDSMGRDVVVYPRESLAVKV